MKAFKMPERPCSPQVLHATSSSQAAHEVRIAHKWRRGLLTVKHQILGFVPDVSKPRVLEQPIPAFAAFFLPPPLRQQLPSGVRLPR